MLTRDVANGIDGGMNGRVTRRRFLGHSALAAVWAAGGRRVFGEPPAVSPNEAIDVAFIGVGGRGGDNLKGLAEEKDVNVVALCDVDDRRLGQAAAKFPKAALYHDFRKLLDREKPDAVVVSTPDHTHASATAAAIRLGYGVYTEKPLTHNVHEARVLAELAAKHGVATQMGNGGHAGGKLRRNVEYLRSGALGVIREAHTWTDRPGAYWVQGIDRPAEVPPVPDSMHWDLWLGPAPERPWHPAYHPSKWRGWWDFGTGALGDMGCHNLDCAFWGLDLESATTFTVEAEGTPRHPETGPAACTVRWEFPARGNMAPVTLTWYEGTRMPPEDLFAGVEHGSNGTLVIGDKGKLLLDGPYGHNASLIGRQEEPAWPEPFIPRSPGHYREWLDAIRSKTPTGSNFTYAASLTETILMGMVAFRVGHKLHWDRAAMKAANCAEADRYTQRKYRVGWLL